MIVINNAHVTNCNWCELNMRKMAALDLIRVTSILILLIQLANIDDHDHFIVSSVDEI